MSVERNTAQRAVEAATRAGATDAGAWVSAGRELSVTVLNGEIEKLEEAESRLLGLRVFTGSKSSMWGLQLIPVR